MNSLGYKERGKEPIVTRRKKPSRERVTLQITRKTEHKTEKEIEAILGLTHRHTKGEKI